MSAAAPAKGIALSAAATPPRPAAAAAAAAVAAAAAAATVPGRGALFAALTDALAGALGSVVAVAVFYPIDVAKTRAQASLSTAPLPPSNHDPRPGNYDSSRGAAPSRRGDVKGAVSASGREGGWFKSRTLSALVSLVRNEGASRLYEGIEAKALQSLLGSFIYFYAYAFIKGAMRRRLQRGGVGAAPGGGSSKSLRPSLNLLAAALAGAINQIFTLPLENITTRMQTAKRSPPPPMTGDDSGSTPAFRRKPPVDDGGSSPAFRRRPVTPREDAVGREHGAAAAVAVAGGLARTEDEIVRAEGVNRDRSSGHTSAASAGACCLPQCELQQHQQRHKHSERNRRRRQRQSLLAVAGDLYREGNGIARFWRGFVPSLVLTCNPAINYTAFDLLKALWLRRRAAAEAGAAAAAATAAAAAGGGGGAGGSARGIPSAAGIAAGSEGFLNPVEAFLVAAAAKSIATLITYPLIRAKVVLMTSSSTRKSSPSASPSSSSPCSCSCYCSSCPCSCPCTCSYSHPSSRFPPAGGAASAAASKEDGVFGRSEDGDCQQGVGDDKTAEDSASEDVRGGAVGTRQQERERQQVSREDERERQQVSREDEREGQQVSREDVYSRLARGGSWVCGDDDVTAAAAAAAAAGWEGARGRGGDGDARSMGTVILDIFRQEGIGGLYTGCGAQLLHTILKSALLLATKEQIARAAASAVLLL